MGLGGVAEAEVEAWYRECSKERVWRHGLRCGEELDQEQGQVWDREHCS